jgi:hypothetical protein
MAKSGCSSDAEDAINALRLRERKPFKGEKKVFRAVGVKIKNLCSSHI